MGRVVEAPFGLVELLRILELLERVGGRVVQRRQRRHSLLDVGASDLAEQQVVQRALVLARKSVEPGSELPAAEEDLAVRPDQAGLYRVSRALENAALRVDLFRQEHAQPSQPADGPGENTVLAQQGHLGGRERQSVNGLHRAWECRRAHVKAQFNKNKSLLAVIMTSPARRKRELRPYGVSHHICLAMDEDFDYDLYDRLEDEALARLRDNDAMSDEDTESDMES